MYCGTHCKTKRFCPVSFGLALGITGVIAQFAMMFFSMHGKIMLLPWKDVAYGMLMTGIVGFFFGLVFALIYNLIQSACTSRFCCKSNGSCGCGKENCECCKNKVENQINKP